MLRFTLAIALVSACLSLSAPSAAIADEGLAGLCALAGGSMNGDVCVLPDGRTVTCADEKSECVIHDAPPALFRPLGNLINVPKLLFKKPAGPGPVEMAIEKGSTIKLTAPTRRLSDAVASPSSDKTIKLHDAPMAKMDPVTVAPL